jgi:hypothetical protein
MEDVGNGDHLRIYVHNKTSQTINVDFSFDLEHRSLSYKNDTILPDSIPQLCGIGFKDVIGEKAILTLREEFHNKHLVIKNIDGDTLASWRDSSLVFLDQYWTINPQDRGEFTGCTLQLTDEVLKLK